jgi:hypothetical protein
LATDRSILDARCPTYRLHDTTGDDLGLIDHPAPNVEPGDGRRAADASARFRNPKGSAEDT